MARWLDLPRRLLSTLRQAEHNTGRTTRRRRPSARHVERGVRIEYTPSLDGDPDPGEVVWAWVPYEDDPTMGKDRPVLVIGLDGPHLLAVPLSSKDHDQRRDHAEWVDVGTGAWDGQHRQSHANASRLLRYVPTEVRREGG